MKVTEIWNAEYYRDSGSYSFSFVSDDDEEYEFISQVADTDSEEKSYKSPVIFWQDCNSGRIFRELNWIEAKSFIEPLEYENEIFHEFKRLINRYAAIT